LRLPELHQFAQRIAVDYDLKPLTLEETWQYIRHRLKVAGGDPNLFDTRACAAVYYYTGGTPRLINVMCDTALVCGFAEGKRKIDVDVIYEVVREKKKGGIFPIIDKKPGIDTAVVRELPIVRKEGGGS
jgi:type II secretory pathway predicted ATPase ExeA